MRDTCTDHRLVVDGMHKNDVRMSFARLAQFDLLLLTHLAVLLHFEAY